MKKLRLFGIVMSILLIIYSAIGFSYIIKVNGAGPAVSWSCGMGPLIIGIFILLAVSYARGGEYEH